MKLKLEPKLNPKIGSLYMLKNRDQQFAGTILLYLGDATESEIEQYCMETFTSKNAKEQLPVIIETYKAKERSKFLCDNKIIIVSKSNELEEIAV